MKTFELRGGDLALGPAGHSMITGPTKVHQDLSVALREPLGCDRFHGKWGSIMSDMVGGVVGDETRLRIHSEVTRLVANYIAVQSDQIVADYSQRQRSRFGASEIVTGIKEITIRPQADRIYLKVVVLTSASGEVTLTSAVGV